MRFLYALTAFCSFFVCKKISALRFDVEQIDWNLNQNETARIPLEYRGHWQDHGKCRALLMLLVG